MYSAFALLFFTNLPDVAAGDCPVGSESFLFQMPRTPSMTVIVHGTNSTDDCYYQPQHYRDRDNNPIPPSGDIAGETPEGDFHQYLRTEVFSDTYNEWDFFFWSGGCTESDRVAGAEKLKNWSSLHPTDRLRLVSHSHGNTVVSKALQLGLEAYEIIYLSPLVVAEGEGNSLFCGSPLPEDYPEMRNVCIKRFFNFHAVLDGVVTCDAESRQNFDVTPVDRFEQEEPIPSITDDGGGLCLGGLGCHCPTDLTDHALSRQIETWRTYVEPLLDAPFAPVTIHEEPIEVECESHLGSQVTLTGEVTNDVGVELVATWSVNAVPVKEEVLPGILDQLGEVFELEFTHTFPLAPVPHVVTLSVENECDDRIVEDQTTVTVVDTTPPDVSISVREHLLRPPNHKLVDVGMEVFPERMRRQNR